MANTGEKSLSSQIEIYMSGVAMLHTMDAAAKAAGKFSITGEKKASEDYDLEMKRFAEAITKLESNGDKSKASGQLFTEGKKAQMNLAEIKALSKDNRVDIVQFRARSIFKQTSSIREEVCTSLSQIGENILPALESSGNTDSKLRKIAFFIRANTLVERSKQMGRFLNKLSSNSAVDQTSKEKEFEVWCKSLQTGVVNLDTTYAGDADLTPYLNYVKSFVISRLGEAKSIFAAMNSAESLGPDRARIWRKGDAAADKDLLEELRGQL